MSGWQQLDYLGSHRPVVCVNGKPLENLSRAVWPELRLNVLTLPAMLRTDFKEAGETRPSVEAGALIQVAGQRLWWLGPGS